MKTSAISTVKLNELAIGDSAVIKSVSSSNRSLCNKLLSMGLVAGTAIEMLCVAPLGDPIQIQALGYKLSLRVSEAETVQVVPVL